VKNRPSIETRIVDCLLTHEMQRIESKCQNVKDLKLKHQCKLKT